ncbi:CIC11C00000005356 [Sungouiella intermedia]|uniref:CIC11C00000005356 n=1 Tax=Sungouiella intermedia TaxID=45354 RepID=A0A1L0BBP6_9ASCO|nr:CIC11C00000005356 [[Candida] intermedia]
MSSPSRQVIDPAMYSYADLAPSNKHNSTTTTASTASSGGVLPPASKLLPSTSQGGSAPLTGWTPLISRTFSNEIISHNSTPSSKMLPSMYKQGTNPGSASGYQNVLDYDYPGLNLTPFLTHNLNLMNNPNSAGNFSNNINFTPFYDKSMHLADFFMESPIRKTPLKIETITPSKFSINQGLLGPSRTLEAKLNSALSLKRSITQIDTPARHPYKKYDLGNKADSEDLDSEDKDDNENVLNAPKGYGDNFVTPSKKKVLHEVGVNTLNKTPNVHNSAKAKNLYQTPAKPSLVSSPSTVIMSSAARSPDNEVIKQVPPSPTPLKDKIEVAEPIMGIFSEKKTQEPKPARKQKKQLSGMNRFQIVFTDVHTLMNSRKKKNSGNTSSSKPERSEKKRSHQRLPSNNLQSPSTNFSNQNQASYPSFQQALSSLSASQDFNSTINTSREFSVLGNNSTVNTTNSNLNVTSDHSSFELMHGGLMSTPNGKYLLDNLFERGSPQSINQMPMTHINMEAKSHEHMRLGNTQHMPPPPKSLQQAAQQALRHDQQQPMNMMMSTPQHEHINGHPGVYHSDEYSPSNKDSMAYMYHQLHQFHNMNSPGNMNLHNMHRQPPPQMIQEQQHPNLHDKHEPLPQITGSKTKARKKRVRSRAK